MLKYRMILEWYIYIISDLRQKIFHAPHLKEFFIISCSDWVRFLDIFDTQITNFFILESNHFAALVVFEDYSFSKWDKRPWKIIDLFKYQYILLFTEQRIILWLEFYYFWLEVVRKLILIYDLTDPPAFFVSDGSIYNKNLWNVSQRMKMCPEFKEQCAHSAYEVL